VITLLFILTLHRMLSLVTFFFRGRWGQIPRDIPVPEVRMVSTPNGTIRVLLWNVGKPGIPLVCLHGLNGSPWAWARTAGWISQQYPNAPPIYALSMPGHGDGTQTHNVSVDLENTMKGICRALEVLQADVFHLLGHSWGGKVATYIACKRTAHVKSVVLCDPVMPQGVAPVNLLAPMFVRLGFVAERRVFMTKESLDNGRHYVMHMNKAVDPMEKNLWGDMFKLHGDGHFHPRVPDSLFWCACSVRVWVSLFGCLCPQLHVRLQVYRNKQMKS
jgi:pimeloyl-ACP methyl ester carboxylesterase